MVVVCMEAQARTASNKDDDTTAVMLWIHKVVLT